MKASNLDFYKNYGKIILDYLISFILIIFIWPVILFCWIWAAVETRSNGFFLHERIGKNGQRFKIIKIKTMKNDSSGGRSSITALSVSQVTWGGKWMRRYKLDELPQLINIIRGEMSFVGPRPDVPGYADLLTGEAACILDVKPGITGSASLKYRNEDALLSGVVDPGRYADEIIWPDKVRVNIEYVKNITFKSDFEIVLKTLGVI